MYGVKYVSKCGDGGKLGVTKGCDGQKFYRLPKSEVKYTEKMWS